METGPPASTHGRITDEGIAELERRVGAYYQSGPNRLTVTADDILLHAAANGDINPLFSDPAYAAGTRFGGLIAPPTYVDLIKHYTATAIGGLPGVHAFHVGNAVEFFAPVRPATVIGPTFRPWKVHEKSGKFAGRMVSMDCEIVYRNQRDDSWRERTARCSGSSGDRAQPREVRRAEKATVLARSARRDLESRRERRDSGRKPRYWEDVKIGDTLGPIVRGPLRVVEISFRNWAGGGLLTGAGAMAYGAHYFQFEEYLRRPGLAEVEEGTGVMDHPHRGHWEESFARKIGVPGVYDIAVQRTAWMTTLMTNWAGDDGWVRSVNSQFRFFNVEGDATWVHGLVTGKRIEGNLYLVDLELRCVNQRDQVSTTGGGSIVLPTHQPGSTVPG